MLRRNLILVPLWVVVHECALRARNIPDMGYTVPVKDLVWLATTRKDVRAFPRRVQRAIGYALFLAQSGEKGPDAKPLRGFGGAGVVEIVEHFDGNTYRAVYTVKFEHAVYVLHAFQKKSTRGIATAQQDIALIRTRLRLAEDEDRRAKE